MAAPTSRQTFKDYCLRKLGAPVIEINVDPEQVEDAVDDALLMFKDYHFDGIEHVYEKHLVTTTDITNKFFTLDPAITGVTCIFDVGMSININSLFNLRYQIRLNDLFDFSSKSYVPYVMAMRHIETLQETFVGKKPIRFNRYQHILYVDFDWTSDVNPGDFVILDAYRVVDPNVYIGIWNDIWLKKYATALVKKQWGQNMNKFQNIPLLGGVMMNGKDIYETAVAEIKDLEKELLTTWSLPSMDMTG